MAIIVDYSASLITYVLVLYISSYHVYVTNPCFILVTIL